jgi:hypothetical protein
LGAAAGLGAWAAGFTAVAGACDQKAKEKEKIVAGTRIIMSSGQFLLYRERWLPSMKAVRMESGRDILTEEYLPLT